MRSRQGRSAQGPSGPIAVSGANGRLGSALRGLLEARGADVRAWLRADLDLDRPETAEAAVARDAPRLVIHCAAWTDVDGCARRPDLALLRNGTATGILARACARAGADLVVVSTNEVFDGRRTDGRGYREDDATDPPNPYGASKLAGERAALDAWAREGRTAGGGRGGRTAARDADRSGTHDGLWIVRTAWLFGPPGADFPTKIVAAADRLPPGEALPVVADETGSPTLAADLAAAILALVEASPGGTFHLANEGVATRFDWAREVLARRRPERPLRAIDSAAFSRPSSPPAWGVLDTTRAAELGVVLRPWEEALAESLGARSSSAG